MSAPAPRTTSPWIGGVPVPARGGRSHVVAGADGAPLAAVGLAGADELSAAVAAARGALAGLAARGASRRAQVLFAAADSLAEREASLAATWRLARGLPEDAARAALAAALDRARWFAGLADKLSAVLGSVDDVARPFVALTSPGPAGVVVLGADGCAPPALLAALFAAFAPGNAVVLVAGADGTGVLAADLAEALAPAGLPNGALSVLTGALPELLALAGATPGVDVVAVAHGAADAARVLGAGGASGGAAGPHVLAGELPDEPGARLAWVEPFVAWTTLWHPAGF